MEVLCKGVVGRDSNFFERELLIMRRQGNMSFYEWYRVLRQYRHWGRLASLWYALYLSL
jgi:hypothetical protein